MLLIREFPISPFWGHPGCEVAHVEKFGDGHRTLRNSMTEVSNRLSFFIFLNIFYMFFTYFFLFFLSLNSLAVRVPHNISRRVLQTQGPNPLLEIGFTTLVFKKPVILSWLLLFSVFFTIKPLVFFTVLHFYDKTNGFQHF